MKKKYKTNLKIDPIAKAREHSDFDKYFNKAKIKILNCVYKKQFY